MKRNLGRHVGSSKVTTSKSHLSNTAGCCWKLAKNISEDYVEKDIQEPVLLRIFFLNGCAIYS